MTCSWPNYGLERGLGDDNCATDYDDVKAYTPAWAEQITGVSRHNIIRIRPRVRGKRRQDPRPVDGHRRRRR